MDYKQLSSGINDLDEAQGIVKAYANAYDNEDSHKDISDHGSFNKTVAENKKRIRVLKDHNTTISLGVPLEIDTKDRYGLMTVTKFNLKKEVSRDMFTDIQLMKQHGLNAELSIGYDIIARSKDRKERITEYRLWEYSFLTSWAANELATVGDIKSVKSLNGIIEIIEKSYNLNYSDPRLRKIETLLKTLGDKPSESDTSTEPLSKADRSLIINTFKLNP